MIYNHAFSSLQTIIIKATESYFHRSLNDGKLQLKVSICH